MSTEHIIRAWRDEEYRESLNAEQSAILPESPVGAIDLTEREMAQAEGGDWGDAYIEIFNASISSSLWYVYKML
jgi:mersacidin/lichenicidin family type 2 lantibiotic